MAASSGSAFIAAIASIGRNLLLFRSKITSDGRLSRTRATTASGLRSKNTSAPSDFAAVEILTENIRSSTTQRIMPPSFSFQAIPPGDDLEFAADGVFDRNDGVHLEDERREHRTELVNRHRVVAFHQH